MITIKSATYITKLSPEQFKVELNKVMDTSSFIKSYLSSNIFSGKYSKSKDKFVLWKNYQVRRNTNRPTIHLKVISDERTTGSKILVKIGFNKQFEIFGGLILFLIFGSLTSSSIEKKDFYLIITMIIGLIIIGIFIYLIGLLLFFFEYSSTKRAVEEFMKGIE